MFNVCINHFEQSDLTKKGDKFVLNTSSIPRIFDTTNPQFRKVHESLVDANYVNDELPELPSNVVKSVSDTREASEIANQFAIAINHDVKVQGLQQKIDRLTKENSNKTKQLTEIKSQLNKAKTDIEKMNAVIDEMKSNRYITTTLNERKRVELEEIEDCLCNGIQNGKDSYPEYVRSFCLTTHFYSPRAYAYIRDKFNNHLPHESTLRSWYRNSNIDVTPGIIKNALDILRAKAQKMRQNGKQLVVSLIFDEMSIRKHVQWCPAARQFLGYASYGHFPDDTGAPVASQAIVFMVSGLTEFFQKGANLKGEIAPTIKNPFDLSEIQIILDPSHAEKLVRSTLEKYQVFFDENNDKIEWKYFVELVKCSQDAKNSYGLVHKLTKRHIDFHNRKMCVRTAVELFSNSVADAMEFLMKKGVPKFKNAAATIKFIRIFNRLFDIMNTSRIKSGDIFKCALHSQNKEIIFNFLIEAKAYILSLKISEKKNGRTSIVKSRVKTGFRGFIIDIISIMKLYNEFVENQKCMSFLAVYRLSQDHLEMFFGKIRSMHGCNDNPTVQQFTSALKKLLHHVDVIISTWSNISISCSSNILSISSRRVKLNCMMIWPET